MPGGKPLFTEDNSPTGIGKRKAWQGAMLFALGGSISAATWFGYGFVWWGTIATAVVGFFWMLTGLITMFTGYE
jgi:hypothetical protein